MVTRREDQPLRGSIKTTRSVKHQMQYRDVEGVPDWSNALGKLGASLNIIHGSAAVTSATIEGAPDGHLTLHAGGKHVDLNEADATALAAAIIEHLLARQILDGAELTPEQLRDAALGVLDNKVPGAASD